MRSRRGSIVAALALLLVVVLPGGALATTVPEPAPAAPSVAGASTSVVAPPLVVLMDLSGSMDQDDGTGTVKLDGAKHALLDVVDKQPPEAAVGLWTYPGGAQECAPGGYLGGTRPRSGEAEVLSARVRTLRAGGGTPTGPALVAVADALESDQVERATVLLVSDGESNCGQDACEAARDVVRRGLDLTVQAVGFQISAQGRKELECIAAATGGAYSDVRDSAALAERLTTASASPLRLSVEASATTVPAGGALLITATVSNPSATPTADVSLSLVMTGEGGSPLFLTVVPPLVRLGTVPVGEELVPYAWTISTRGAEKGRGSYRVVASAPSVGAVEQEGGVTITDEHLTVDQAGPVLEEALDHGPVVVMGDSYSAGEGAGDYENLGSAEADLCHRSPLTYGAQLFDPVNTRIMACSGAVSAHLTAYDNEHHVDAQIDQLNRLKPPAGLVLLTLGGNDAGFADIIKGCFFSSNGKDGPLLVGGAPVYFRPSECTGDDAFVDRYQRQLSQVADHVSQAVDQIDRTVNSPDAVSRRDGWRAPVVVLAYPQVLPVALRTNCLIRIDQLELTRAVRQYVQQDWSRQVGFSPGEVEWLNDVGQGLDDQVRDGVEAAASRGAPAYFVAPAQEAVQPNHTTCDTDPYINPLSAAGAYLAGAKDYGSTRARPLVKLEEGRRNEFAHPNTAGYRATADVLVAWSQGVAAPGERKGAVGPPPPTAPASDPVVTVVLDGTSPTTVDVRAGDAVRIEVRGMAPGSTVTVEVHSAPRTVGALTVGADGTARGVVYIPPDLPAGAHTLVADGAGTDGRYRSSEQPLRVSPPRPWWFWPAGAGALAAAAGALALLRSSRRSTRTTP